MFVCVYLFLFTDEVAAYELKQKEAEAKNERLYVTLEYHIYQNCFAETRLKSSFFLNVRELGHLLINIVFLQNGRSVAYSCLQPYWPTCLCLEFGLV